MNNLSTTSLSNVLGFEVFSIEQEDLKIRGAHCDIYGLITEIGDLILKKCKGKQGYYTQYFEGMISFDNWLNQKWAIENAIKNNIPAPELIYTNRLDHWMIVKRLPGIPIDSEYENWTHCPYHEEEFGEILKRMHSITPNGFGPIDDYGKSLFSSWSEFLLQIAEIALNYCYNRGSIDNLLFTELKEKWATKLKTIVLDRPSLLHMESLGFANILHDQNGNITGFLDYEDCIGGDPYFEFVWMKYYFEHDNPNQSYFSFKNFTKGYGTINYQDCKFELYKPFTYLDKLRWIEPQGERAARYREILLRSVKESR